MKKKILIMSITFIVVILTLMTIVPFIVLGLRNKHINNDYMYLINENKIQEVKIENVPLVKQEISCGYAIIEMISAYENNRVTENELYTKNNNQVTSSTTDGFVVEINKNSSKHYVSKIYMKNDDLLLTINKSLINGNPVAVEWAALFNDEWTLHWSVVTGMDHDFVYINNSYGYLEKITYEEFISRTTFNAFKDMPIFYQFGFAYGLFSKNTIIVVE